LRFGIGSVASHQRNNTRPASDGRRPEATFAGIETGSALMLMPMVLAQLPAAGKPSKDLQRPNAS